MRTSFLVMALALCGGASGTAKAVVVTFDAANGYNTNVEGSDFERASGTWVEAGFDVAWDYVDGGPDQAIGDLDGGLFLAGCGGGCGGTFIELVFTRPDLADFTPTSLDVSMVRSSFLGVVFRKSLSGTDPEFDSDFYVIVPDLELEGTRRDGTVVTVVTPSMLDGTTFQQAGYPVPYSGDGVVDVSGIDDVVELRASITARYDDEVLALSRDFPPNADTLLAEVPEDCSVTVTCTVPGVAEYRIFIDSGNFWNYSTAAFVSDFRFDVAPAPIPLPAAGWMLLAGLGGMGWMARRRR